jgi:hypothetical protein
MTNVLVITTRAPQAARVVRRTEGHRTERAHGPRAGRRGRMGRARTRVGAWAVAGVRRAWCAGRRGAGRRGRTGRTPDGGAPDGEGPQAGHARGWGRRAGVGRRLAGGEVGLFPVGAGGESVGEIWKLLRVCGLGKPYPPWPGLSLNFQRPDPGRWKLT